jgi:glycosyltransferase involved in cell wall biosynthesis
MTNPTPPRILVLLTTHNGADFLAEQLDSVLAQRGRFRR